MARLAGTVILQCVVDREGRARDFQVSQSLGLGLDQNAILAVSTWLFEPGRKAGEPVNVIATVQVNFRLLDRNSTPIGWHLSRAEFQTSQGTMRPTVFTTAVLQVAPNAGPAKATIGFVVDSRGIPVDLRVESSSDPDWARDVTAALLRWKFNPGRKGGEPVPVPASMDFVRGN